MIPYGNYCNDVMSKTYKTKLIKQFVPRKHKTSWIVNNAKYQNYLDALCETLNTLPFFLSGKISTAISMYKIYYWIIPHCKTDYVTY